MSPVAKVMAPLTVSVCPVWSSTGTLAPTLSVAPLATVKPLGKTYRRLAVETVPMAFSATLWPLLRVPAKMSMSWKLLLSLPPPAADNSGTSVMGRYSGWLKASLDRSPALNTEPALSVT